jgi:tetrahydromethanopterin S-methyltransferase subunit G
MMRKNYEHTQLGDIRQCSSQLSSEYCKQSKVIMERLDNMESRLNNHLNKIDTRLDHIEYRLDNLKTGSDKSK